MHFNSLLYTSRPAIMHQKVLAALGVGRQTKPPQGRCPPFRGLRAPFGVAIIKSAPHIMEQQIGIRMKGFIGKGGNRGKPRFQGLPVAALATQVYKRLLSLLYLRVVLVPLDRRF